MGHRYNPLCGWWLSDSLTIERALVDMVICCFYHVLTETFAFNLLERMLTGLLQMVGETGWQLSHGERNRLYLARALLQGADLTILDESFAVLDHKNLRWALAGVLNRVKTLLVIAHP